MSASMGVTIDQGQLRAVLQTMSPQGYRRASVKPANDAMRAATIVVKNAARRELGAHRRTGRMRSAVRTRAWVRGSALGVFGVKSQAPQSNLIAGGVGRHTIDPGKVMPMWGGRGAWKRGAGRGIEGFARRVEHPGFAGDPFFDRAIDASAAEVNRLLDAAAQQIAANMAQGMRRF